MKQDTRDHAPGEDWYIGPDLLDWPRRIKSILAKVSIRLGEHVYVSQEPHQLMDVVLEEAKSFPHLIEHDRIHSAPAQVAA